MSKTKWIKLSDRKPTEKELIKGRAPCIDERGFLVTGLFHKGKPIWCDVPIVYWMAIDFPNLPLK